MGVHRSSHINVEVDVFDDGEEVMAVDDSVGSYSGCFGIDVSHVEIPEFERIEALSFLV